MFSSLVSTGVDAISDMSLQNLVSQLTLRMSLARLLLNGLERLAGRNFFFAMLPSNIPICLSKNFNTLFVSGMKRIQKKMNIAASAW
jgi:hypothetical protein